MALLPKGGVNINVVFGAIRHASVVATLDIYGHVGEALQRNAVELLSGQILPCQTRVNS